MATIVNNFSELKTPLANGLISYEPTKAEINLALLMMETLVDEPQQIFKTFSKLVDKCSIYVAPEKTTDFQRHINLMLRRVLVELIETLSKETYLHSNHDLFDIQDQLLEARNKEEIYQRRVQILAPPSQKEFEAALMWMAERGEEEDLDLLYQALPTSPISSDSISKLFNLATQAIIGRVYDSDKELQIAFGLTAEEFAACLLGTTSNSASEQAKENVAKLREIKELWEVQIEPEELKSWVRQPVPLFAGATPLEKFRQGNYRAVVHALILLKEGMPL